MDLFQPANPEARTFREAERPQRYRGRRRNLWSKSKSGQAPAKTPARLEAGAEQWLEGHPAPVQGQVPAGTMVEKVTGKSSRSEEHTSELQSLRHLVCRLLLAKKQ